MRKIDLQEVGDGFRVIETTGRSQMATVVLQPGAKTGGPENQHKGVDQWLYVLRGLGKAVVNEREIDLKAGDLVLIEAGDKHEVRCDGGGTLVTFSVYAPTEY